jgi:hypothetical protein
MRLEPFSSNRRVSDYTGFVELLVVGQPVGHRRRGRQRGSGAELEQVEGVVGAGETALNGVQAEVGWEAAQHHPLAGLQLRHDLGPFPR